MMMMMMMMMKTNDNIERIPALIYTKRKARPLREQEIHNKRRLKKMLHTYITKKWKKK